MDIIVGPHFVIETSISTVVSSAKTSVTETNTSSLDLVRLFFYGKTNSSCSKHTKGSLTIQKNVHIFKVDLFLKLTNIQIWYKKNETNKQLQS